MEVLTENRANRSLFVQGLVLLLSAIVGMLAFIILAFLIIALLFGPAMLFSMDWMLPGPKANVAAIKIVLTAQQIGLFLVPAIALALFEKQNWKRYYGFSEPSQRLVGLSVAFMLIAMPALSAVNLWNQGLTLPPFLKEVEEWMKAKEAEAMGTTKLILSMPNWLSFLSSLLVVAVIPAICEEFLFRGALQKLLGKVVKNHHFQVWFAATIFSIIHFQFYGFFPRLLLGAAFGYLYIWSGNIWYAIIAHFINNAFAVCMSFYYQQKGLDIDQEPDITQSFFPIVLSLGFALWFIYRFFKNRKLQKEAPLVLN